MGFYFYSNNTHLVFLNGCWVGWVQYYSTPFSTLNIRYWNLRQKSRILLSKMRCRNANNCLLHSFNLLFIINYICKSSGRWQRSSRMTKQSNTSMDMYVKTVNQLCSCWKVDPLPHSQQAVKPMEKLVRKMEPESCFWPWEETWHPKVPMSLEEMWRPKVPVALGKDVTSLRCWGPGRRCGILRCLEGY